MSKQRILVVANRTADSPELIAGLRSRGTDSSARFTLLVPAVPRGLAWAADMKAGWADAIGRAEAAAERISRSGLGFDGAIVGDPDPFAAVGDVLHLRKFDEVIVSTLPPGISSWLRLSLPDRLRRATELPVTQMTVNPGGASPAHRERELVGAAS